AASVMRTMDQDMQRSAEGASQTSDVLRRILDAAHRTAEVISDISNAAREQRAASEQIASRVEQIAQHAGDAASSVQQSVGNAEALQDRDKELEDAIKALRSKRCRGWARVEDRAMGQGGLGRATFSAPSFFAVNCLNPALVATLRRATARK